MLRAQSLALIRHGVPLVEDVDVSLDSGQILVIAGPNGAGKTSLLRLLSGELSPTQGIVELDGKSMSGYTANDLARRRAVMQQSESLRFSFSVRQVLELGRHPWHGNRAQDEDAIDAVLKLADLNALADRPYPALSGGERARVQFARALVQLWPIEPPRPGLLLLDEPTASLDLAVQSQILRLLRDLARRGLSVAVILHDLNQALQLADQVLLMKDGRMLAAGRGDEVLQADPIREAFGIEIERLPRGDDQPPWIIPST